MSLTSHLKDPTSPVNAYLRTRLPNTARLAAPVNTELRTLPCLRPPEGTGTYPWGTIGQAVDYRLRYAFAITPSDHLVAHHGMRSYTVGLPGQDVPATSQFCAMEAAWGFFDQLDATLARLQPVGRRLAPAAERELVRYCYVLALFETVFRSAGEYGPLFTLPRKETVADLLAAVDEAWVEDLCQLQDLFMLQQQDLLTRPYVLNPIFSGSVAIGGADADLIVDGCLLDIKTTIKSAVEPEWLRQLAGYALLDWEDAYHIQAVWLYLSRQGLLVRWPVEEFFGTLTGDPTVTVADLRQEFEAVVLKARDAQIAALRVRGPRGA